jgi:phosphatidylserine/phosphatidylglycerophosphate/cardiolipin synthase-like enzyme
MLQPHNFMHNKLLVADQIVATGSFNLSNDAMGNAENVLLNPGCGNRRTIREIYSAFNGELRCHKRSGYVTEASTAWARRLNPKRPIRRSSRCITLKGDRERTHGCTVMQSKRQPSSKRTSAAFT